MMKQSKLLYLMTEKHTEWLEMKLIEHYVKRTSNLFYNIAIMRDSNILQVQV